MADRPNNPSLPSPASTTSFSSINRPPTSSALPQPRRKSLRPGSSKEELVRRYVDGRTIHMARRYVRKHMKKEEGDVVEGYQNVQEVCADFDDIVNVVWLSGTPSLQIPILLNVASEFTKFAVSFRPSFATMYALLRKLDHCFASLLHGEDITTNTKLPGFEKNQNTVITITEMVRCRSVVEQTRMLMLELATNPRYSGNDDDDDDNDGTGSNDEQIDDEDYSAPRSDGRTKMAPATHENRDRLMDIDSEGSRQQTFASSNRTQEYDEDDDDDDDEDNDDDNDDDDDISDLLVSFNNTMDENGKGVAMRSPVNSSAQPPQVTSHATYGTESNDEASRNWLSDNDDDDSISMCAAKVYENTLISLSEKLGDSI